MGLTFLRVCGIWLVLGGIFECEGAFGVQGVEGILKVKSEGCD